MLLGPNGAGKSTLLRVLATIVTPDRGSVRVAGYDVVSERDRVHESIGVMLADDRGWYWRISARRNLEFHAALGAGAEATREHAESLLETFGLAEHADRRVGTYSSGMRARLGLVRAMATRPPVLLLDEPSSRLDPAAAVELRESIKRVAAGGTAILLATHDLREAADVADDVVALSGGKVAFRAAAGVTAGDLEARMLAAA